MKLKNGKELNVALKEVAVYKDKSKSLQGKYGYYEKSEYHERLVQVFGEDGYTVDYVYNGLEVLPGNQVMVIAKCTLCILGENGNVVHSVSGIGTEEIEFSDKNGKYIMLNNVGSSVDTSAFKEACRQLNIFNCVMEKKPNNSANGSTNANYGKNDAEAKVFVPKGKLVEAGKTAGDDGKPYYKQKGIIDGVDTELLFYHNNYSKDGSWGRYFDALGNFTSINVNCEKARNGTGYIFRSFVKKGA